MDVAVVGMGVASPMLNHPGDILGHPVTPTSAFDPAALLGERGYRYNDRATQLGMLAATRAFQDAALLNDGVPEEGGRTVPGASCGVVASSNLGNLDTVCRTADVLASESVVGTSPMDLPNASSNIVASSIAVKFGLHGPNVMVCNGASSGLDAVYLATVLITSGRACRVVVIGVEPANDVVATLLDTPVDELFDGAVAVLLESAAAATARGVTPSACLGGYARRADLDASIIRALGDHSPPGLWLVRETATPPPVLLGVHRQDIEATLGAASGALGVLQVVAGAQWLGNGGDDPVLLATAGATEDGTSSLLLVRRGAAP